MRFFAIVFTFSLASWAYAHPTDPADGPPQFPTDTPSLGRPMVESGPIKGIPIPVSRVIQSALEFQGTPYHEGGNSIDTGFDCSGFVRSIYSQTIGLLLPRSAEQQAAATKKIERKELRPGDLVFFNTMRRAFSHVGIYIGEGKFIHSTKSGGAVRVDDMALQYWQQRFNGARRVRGHLLATQRMPATDTSAR